MKTKLYLITSLAFAGICMAQGQDQKPAAPAPSKSYRLDFAVKEVEGGKVLNSRIYTTMLSVPQPGTTSIRNGSRVPVTVKTGEFSYIDIGVNIDCRQARELPERLELYISADISTLADDYQGPHASGQPVIRQTRWNSQIVIAPRKPTTIFSSDDATSKRQMQLELTATPVQ